ncbi:hypothetical protein [Grimontia marina]|uniref:Uncharacterized protein n=1 Tax=Grimontia marina TaxID=646534 RepID=A0A128FI43_9GAMM|nr:hypothetical protein [Grimontia marina]CZF86467.1 hypothetical protein GMA8713_04501 [Grimontia marina]
MMQNFGNGRGTEEIVATDADILIGKGGTIGLDLGGKNVEIIDFGFAQTGGDLFVWEPKSKTMWTGNPVITVKPSLPWLLDGHLLETLDSVKKVQLPEFTGYALRNWVHPGLNVPAAYRDLSKQQ